jgi:uncharacterized YccA/Bax inhibitor family protein
MADANIFLRKGFEKASGADSAKAMTIQGTINKTGILTVLLLAGAVWTWNIFFSTQNNTAITPYIYGGAIAGFILALITIFKPTASPYTAPLYAVAEGLFLGGISAMFESLVPGIAVNAFLLTCAILCIMLLLYRFNVLRATPSMVKGIIGATGAIAMIYIVTMVMGVFGVRMPMIYEYGWVGIVFSLVVVGVAAFNLIIDFNFIEQGAAEGLPVYMEWYGAFGLMVTLIWLYLEVARLLLKLNRK